jgi:hypothetical protein
MNINVTTRIARPIDDLWALVADDFTGIANWTKSVVSAVELTDAPVAEGAPSAGRLCRFTDDPAGFGAREAITSYDKANWRLEFDFEPVNAPMWPPVKRNHVVITLSELGPKETELRWEASPELKPHGYVLYPVLKMALTKAFRDLLKELKVHAES